MGVRRTVCVGALLGGALVACGEPPEHEVIADRVSDGISGRTVTEIADALSRRFERSLFEKVRSGDLDAVGASAGSGLRPSPPLAPALEAAGEAWPEALLAGLIRAKGGPDGSSMLLVLGDEGGHPGAVELRERPEGRLDAELLALVVAPTTPGELWSFAISNLVRSYDQELWLGALDMKAAYPW